MNSEGQTVIMFCRFVKYSLFVYSTLGIQELRYLYRYMKVQLFADAIRANKDATAPGSCDIVRIRSPNLGMHD